VLTVLRTPTPGAAGAGDDFPAAAAVSDRHREARRRQAAVRTFPECQAAVVRTFPACRAAVRTFPERREGRG
jgi:hypothetical protein